MFGNLQDRLKSSLTGLRKQARLTSENIQPALQEIRRALLEADTALPVVNSLIENLSTQALGLEVQKSLNPGQVFTSLVQRELTAVLGGKQELLKLKAAPPAVIMMVGLQGAGKTTNLAKVGLWLRKTRKKKCLLVSLDLTRPAAGEQLEILAKQAEVDYYAGTQRTQLAALAREVLEHAQLSGYDCLLVDTAGRLEVEAEVMAEIKQLHAILNPVEVLYVMDSMGGQAAASAAVGFKEAIPITGIIATKLDAAARGGAILSAKYLTALPLKLLSNGEALTDIMDFNPAAMAENMLGMGDVLAVVKKAQLVVDEKDAAALRHGLTARHKFNFNDMRLQLEQLTKLGGIATMADKLGLGKGMGNLLAQKQLDSQNLKFLGLIDSMTAQERLHPELINGSRKLRIAKGAGSSMAQVNQLFKRYKLLQKMMRKGTTAGGRNKLMNDLKRSLPVH